MVHLPGGNAHYLIFFYIFTIYIATREAGARKTNPTLTIKKSSFFMLVSSGFK